MPYQYGIEAKVGSVSVKIPKLKKKILLPPDLWGPFDFWGIEEESLISQWVIDDQLDQVVMQDLSVLVTLDDLADSLSPSLRRGVKQHIKKAIEQIELPEGRSVRRG